MAINVSKKRSMKKHAQKLMIASLIQVILFSVLFAPTTYAASTEHIEFSITQNIAFKSEPAPSDLTFTYQLAPKTIGAPMPSDSSLDKYIFTIDGTDEFLIESIDFNNPGIFIYNVSCITDNKTDFTIDRRIFKIEVHVMPNKEVFLVIYNDIGDKAEKIIFEHVYSSDNKGGSGGNGGSGNTGGGDYPGDSNAEGKIDNWPVTDKPDEIKDAEEVAKEPLDHEEIEAVVEPKVPGVSPKTDAYGSQMLWLILMLLSGLFMLLFLFKNRNSNKDTTGLS